MGFCSAPVVYLGCFSLLYHTHKVNPGLDEANRKVSFRIQPRCLLERCFLRLRLRRMLVLGGTVDLYSKIYISSDL